MIQSVQRAIELLQAIGEQEGLCGARELARQAGLNAATAHHLLKTLTQAGWLALDPTTKGYSLGLTLLQLTEKANLPARWKALAQPYLDTLHGEFGEAVAFVVMHHHKMKIIDWRDSIHPLAVRHTETHVTHPHRWATGRAILAYLPDGQYESALAAHLPDGEITMADLSREFEQIRQQGFARAVNVADSGIAAVGVPFFDRPGHPMGALGVSAPMSRLPDSQMAVVAERMKAAAAQVSSLLCRDAAGEEPQ